MVRLIEDIARELKRARALVSELEDELMAAQLKKIEEDLGLRVGCIVVAGGKRYRVVAIDPGWDQPRIYGNQQKNDGTFSTRRVCLYRDWALEAGL